MMKTTLLATTAVLFGGSIGYADADHRPSHPRPPLPAGAVVVISKHGAPITIAFPSAIGKQAVPNKEDAGPPSLKPITTFSNLNRDRNAQFLSWYGYVVSGHAYSSSSGSTHDFVSSGTREAIPVTGKGKIVSTIRVPTVGGFKVSIYTNSRQNTPGHSIVSAEATGTGTVGDCCTQLVTVTIPATRLRLGTQYWIVEEGYNDDFYGEKGTWLAEDTDYTGDTKAVTQTFYYSRYWTSSGYHSTRHNTSPWEGVTSFTEPAAELQ